MRDEEQTGPNVFLVPRDIGAEDRFTAHWHYLLDNCPELAQAVVNMIAGRAGLPVAVWCHSEDHAGGVSNEQNKPDFLLSTTEWRLICEHKLESPLGPQQLERYLGMCQEALRDYVILISNRPAEIAPAVLGDRRYARPTDGGRAHFMWEDFYPLVAGRDERLCREFAAYMRAHWMHPIGAGPLGDPYSDPVPFRGVAERAVLRLKQEARDVRQDPTGTGIQLRQPHIPGVWLIWAGFSSDMRGAVKREAAREFNIRVFREGQGVDEEYGEVQRPTGHLWRAIIRTREPMGGRDWVVRTYVVPRDTVLLADAHDAVEKLTAIISAVCANERASSD